MVCVVGAGPRGLSVIERLCANARLEPEGGLIDLHVVDPFPAGAGRVWRTDQSRQLLMNTVAGQISVFTDATVDMRGPLEPGPSLYEWAVGLGSQPGGGFQPAHVLDEARRLGPDTYPTRAFYGRYLRWAFGHIVERAPARVSVKVHASLAVALDDEAGESGEVCQRVVLADGTVLHGIDTVILCQGHLPAQGEPAELEFAERARTAGLAYFPPANPAEVDLDGLAAGSTVLLRGLGLNFFDYMAQLTAGRGGAFSRVGGRLVYRPSGREPRMYAGSRRGIPYQARGENEKGAHGRHDPVLFTADRIAELRAAHAGSGLDFREQLWPLIAREVETVYYRTLLTSRGYTAEALRFQDDFLTAGPDEAHTAAVLAAYGIGDKDRWDWELIARPYRDRHFTGPKDFTGWLLDYLREDVAEAGSGNISGPYKAALDVLRDVRNEVRLAVDHGGVHGHSYRRDLDTWYTPLNAFLSIGPPARRVEEMIALIEAGILHVLGPGLEVEIGQDGYTASSPAVPDSRITADTLIEARLPAITLTRTEDRLLRHLQATGQCTTYTIPTPDGGSYETEGLAVTERPFHLVDAAGHPHPHRYAFGVPTEAVHWVTAAGIRPGVNSVTLTEADAIARAALAYGPDDHTPVTLGAAEEDGTAGGDAHTEQGLTHAH